MNGIFILKTSNGYEVTRVDSGAFPMDWFPHKVKAVDYGKRIARQFDLPLFVQWEA